MRRIACYLLLFATSSTLASAKDKGAVRAAESACGPLRAHLRLAHSPSIHEPAVPPRGQGLVYVAGLHSFGIEVGVDGAWKGLISPPGHIILVLPPGLHHFCVRIQRWQSRYAARVALAALQVEPDRSYYFAASAGMNSIDVSGPSTNPVIGLRRMNEDEGKFLVAATPADQLRPVVLGAK